jgi:hypothetical protein
MITSSCLWCGKEFVHFPSEPRIYCSHLCAGQSRAKIASEENLKHGHRRRGTHSPEYAAWRAMRERCNNPSHPAYRNYGGRGITVCNRWLTFENFLVEMGLRPEGKSLDRYPNNDGNYEPGNCRWATTIEQHNNTRNNHLLTFQGMTKNVGEWAVFFGIPHRILRCRLKLGWSIERALTQIVRYRSTANQLTLAIPGCVAVNNPTLSARVK